MKGKKPPGPDSSCVSCCRKTLMAVVCNIRQNCRGGRSQTYSNVWTKAEVEDKGLPFWLSPFFIAQSLTCFSDGYHIRHVTPPVTIVRPSICKKKAQETGKMREGVTKTISRTRGNTAAVFLRQQDREKKSWADVQTTV